MIHSVTETSAARPTARAAKATPSGEGGFASELEKQTKTKKDTSAKDAKPAAPKLERTDPVEGHLYAEITAGPRNGMYLNTSGNERHGKAFLIVERAGRTFHVYGTGANRAVFEVKPEHKTPAPTAPAAATTPVTPQTTAATTSPAIGAPATPVATTTTPVAQRP